MIKQSILYLSLFWLLCCQSISPPLIYSDNEADIIYYSETGHTIREPFLTYYRQTEGLIRLGYPITEALMHEGWQVQYFQYGRLEIHPENEPDYFITVAWLGQHSHRTKPRSPIRSFTDGRYFLESGYTLEGDFLTFFEENGATVQFGNPISPPFIYQGRVVQDLQSTRLIWYPELPKQHRVQLEPLGENYFLQSGLPLTLLDPISPPLGAILYQPYLSPWINPNILSITHSTEETPHPNIMRLRISVFHNQQPVAGYQLYLRWQEQTQTLPPTRPSGQTHYLLPVTNLTDSRFEIYDLKNHLILIHTISHEY